MDINTGLDKLKEIILHKKTHEDYDRTVKLAKKYKALISGEGIEDYLQQFVRREDKELFEQRKKITQAITPAVAEAIMKPFYKVSRTNRVYQAIDGEESKKAEIQKAIKSFWGEGEQSGLDYWMQTRFIELSFSDPNAFVAVEFDAFDPKIEKAKPKPVEITSEQAIYFEYKNAILQYLVAKWDIEYKAKSKDAPPKKGERFVMYLTNEALELKEIDPESTEADLPDGYDQIITVGKDGGSQRKFAYRLYEPKSGAVPAMRIGYKRDIYTNGRTYVSPLHPALPYFMKSLKTVSELDLSLALHTFPQKLQYVQPCSGVSGKGCNGGKTRSGENCTQCNGSGVSPVHKTGQEVLLLPMPKDKEQIVDLEKLVVYKTPPIDLIKFQKEYVDSLKEDAMKAVFNGDQFVKNTVAATATEREFDMDAVYDTLDPFAKRYSSVWLQTVRLIAVYVEASEGVELYHKFPSDFKLRSQASLISELKLANESGAPSYIVDAINADLMEILYADDQDTLVKLKVKQKYLPFKGKTPAQIQLILASDLTPKYQKILYTNFEEIFDDLEYEHGDKFYAFEDKKQRDLIKAKVDAMIKEMEKAAAKAFQTGGLPQIGNEDDPQ